MKRLLASLFAAAIAVFIGMILTTQEANAQRPGFTITKDPAPAVGATVLAPGSATFTITVGQGGGLPPVTAALQNTAQVTGLTQSAYEGTRVGQRARAGAVPGRRGGPRLASVL
jgi:hypothetical protein